MATREDVLDQWATQSVTNLYQQILGRAPDAAGLEFYKNIAKNEGLGSVQNALVFSQENAPREAERIQARQAEQEAIRAAAEARTAERVAARNAEIQAQVQAIRDRVAADQAAIAAGRVPPSAGGQQVSGGQTGGGQTGMDRATAEGLVRNTFQTVLNRQPLQGGLDFWVNQLMSGAATADDLGVRVAQGATGNDLASAQRWLQGQGISNGAVIPDRATAENLVRNAFQTIFNRQPLQGGLDFWVNQLLTGAAAPEDLFTRVAQGAQGEDVAAAQRWLQANLGQTGQSLTPDPLAISGETEIDPAIAPYLQEALGVARNLFLTGPGPQLYPGQMYVSPSQQTLQALQQAETLVTSPQAQQLGQQGLQAYGTALGGLQSMAAGDYLQSPEYQRYLESVTRPVTEQITQQILPSIASQYSAAGRYGSGAMTEATGRATELGTRALGDVTAQVAQQQQGRMLEAQTSLPSFLGALPSVMQGALAPSTALAGVGAQREAIAGQPLQEAIRRFEYGQQLPYSQLSGYLSSIYGSPLGRLTGQPDMPGSSTLQNIGGALNVLGAIPSATRGIQTGLDFLGGLRF